MLTDVITNNEWLLILGSVLPGGDNWHKFKNANNVSCLESCPAWIKCKKEDMHEKICSDDWKKTDFTLYNLDILFHILNNFDHYNQKDLADFNKDSNSIKELRQFLYEQSKRIKSKQDIEQQLEEDEIGLGIEDLTKLRNHKSVERNQKLVKDAKEIHGYKCHACGFDFFEVYGETGRNYIEAHHLQVLSKHKGKTLYLDPKNDFSVLCSNCHRMIHKTEFTKDVNEFKTKILKNC